MLPTPIRSGIFEHLPARACALLLTVAALSACSFAPGMHAGHIPDQQARTEADSSAKTAARGPADADDATASAAANLIPITPDLIRRQRASRSVDIASGVKQLFGAAGPYKIGAGDVLNIVVWDHPELAIAPAGGLGTDTASLSGVGNGYNVSPQGQIQFPFIGAMPVGGLTEYEARDQIARRLAKYLKDPQVTVRVQSYRSGRVYVDGEVKNPGLQAINDLPMTLPEAIARAGGFTATADRAAIAITRSDTTTRVSLPALTERGINPNNILLGAGDLVRVLGREESKVFVLGEVSRPTTLTLRDGHLTLSEALGEAGGVNPGSADPQQIFVVRSANSERPEIYHLDGRSPAGFALAEGFELRARDVVYVDPVPLVRWHRVISLILPSAQVAASMSSTLRP